MAWEVEGTDEFAEWYGSLAKAEQTRVEFVIGLLEGEGPLLGRPYADTLRDSQYPNMKELRTRAGGDQLRIFFAFDPRRVAILLTGGDKTGDDQFYTRMIATADALYADHLKTLGA